MPTTETRELIISDIVKREEKLRNDRIHLYCALATMTAIILGGFWFILGLALAPYKMKLEDHDEKFKVYDAIIKRSDELCYIIDGRIVPYVKDAIAEHERRFHAQNDNNH